MTWNFVMLTLTCGVMVARCGDLGSSEEFLRRSAGFIDQEVDAARAGQRVVRTTDPGIPQEMVTVGVTRFDIPFAYYLQRAKSGDLYRKGPTLLQLGTFSKNPTVADLKGLTLDGGDLSAFHESDELAAREFLVRVVREHSASGASSQDALTLRANSSAYLQMEMPMVSEYYAWAKVDIGLRNLVRITKVTVYQQDEQAAVVTEQLFASRYFQASLQVDRLMASEGGTYLVTINRGRCDLLTSAIARLLRPIIMKRTSAATKKTLDLAKATLEQEFTSRSARALKMAL